MTPVAAMIAMSAGSWPARISGTTIRMTTTRVRARAMSDRTPRQPPTIVTAAAKMASSKARTGIRYRSATAMNVESGSAEALTTTASPTS